MRQTFNNIWGTHNEAAKQSGAHHVTVGNLVWLQTKFKFLWFFTKQLSAEHFIDALREKKQINITLIHFNKCFHCNCCSVAEEFLHFPLKTAISGLNFFSFSTRILPPSRNSLLLVWKQEEKWLQYTVLQQISHLKANRNLSLTQTAIMIPVFSSNVSTTHNAPSSPSILGLPWEIFAPWCRPRHHVGEAHFVLDWQGGVMHVVELLLSKSRQKQALPWN